MEAFCQYAVAASREALEDAGLDMEKEDPWRVGVAVGSGIGSLQAMEREYGKLLEKGPNRVNPFLVPMMISNMAAGNVSIQFGLKGKALMWLRPAPPVPIVSERHSVRFSMEMRRLWWQEVRKAASVLSEFPASRRLPH